MFETNNTNSDMNSFLVSLGGKINSNSNSSQNSISCFTTVDEEIYSLNNGVALRYLNDFSIIELKGNDSLDFLHRISTNSVKDLAKEEIRKTIFTSEKGRIIGLATILNFDGYLLLVTNISSKQKVTIWINKYIIGDDVKVSDASHRFNIFEVSGPQSNSFLSLFVGNTPAEIQPNFFKVVNGDGILFFLAKLKDHKNSDKFWILAEQENGKKLISNMIENKGPFDFSLIGEDAYNAYRIENGIAADPNELNDNYNPHEAKLIDLVDFKKGCYIGQEVIARLDTYDKVQKNLVGLCFAEPIEKSESFSLFDDKKNEVGTITSVAYSPKLKKNIALGYIKKSLAVQGTKVIAKNGIKSLDVLVHELPFKK
jgi:tRNA-modifying protein YgfZ